MGLADTFYYQPVQIDTINTRVNADLFAKEGDANGRGLLVTLTENGLMKDTTGITLILKWEHTSVGNQGLDNFEAIDPSKGLYKITYPTEMLSRGKVRAFIRIIDSGKLAGTRNIEITVDRGVGDDTAIASSDSFSALASALIEVQSWNDRIDVVEQEFIDKANNLDATYPIELNSVKQQLAETLNKSAITLSHMFADNTVRDTYFIANPTELTEQLFIKVGTGYQQRLSGSWQASTAIVAEQLSATSQPIVDTGNYFATDNTNAALQELGAHKASSENPHGVTKAQVGLGNVDNTSDANKPVSTAVQTALNLKANNVQEAWITPTLLNGWVNFDSGYASCQYRIDSLGTVHLKGMIRNGTLGVPCFTLALGYRPIESQHHLSLSSDIARTLTITSSGDVRISSMASKSWVSFNGITFKI